MKKRGFTFVVLMLLAVMIGSTLLFSGCGGQGKESESREAEEPAGSSGDEDEVFKVALLLVGEITDMGWNKTAYDGLMYAKDKYGVEVAYTEKVAASDMEGFFRGYAEQGYDLIIGHGFQFQEAAKAVAAQFPDVKFAVTSTNAVQAPNLASVYPNEPQQGFIEGAIAALFSKNQIIGRVGGIEIPAVLDCMSGFEAGAKYINPDIKVLKTFIGSMDDLAKAKESAFSMIEQGADVLVGDANVAGVGVIEAAKERGCTAIGTNSDQNSVAPETVPVSVLTDGKLMISMLVEKLVKGEFEPEFYLIGVKEGVYPLSPWYGDVSQEIKDRVNEVIKELHDGKLELESVLQKN
jgi:basic membrane protein A